MYIFILVGSLDQNVPKNFISFSQRREDYSTSDELRRTRVTIGNDDNRIVAMVESKINNSIINFRTLASQQQMRLSLHSRGGVDGYK
jgi:hypothetical protein